jgi:PBP1b-binding outer membrane lipoprotein LpoB
MKRSILLMSLVAGALFLSGCNSILEVKPEPFEVKTSGKCSAVFLLQ